MDWKKIGKAMLFPHVLILVLLLPVAGVLLTIAMMTMEQQDPLRIASYVLAFYTLCILCARVPQIIRFCKTFQNENRYARIWLNNVRLRMGVTLMLLMFWNGGYAILQLVSAVQTKSYWYCSLTVYYMVLAIMRAFLARYTVLHTPGENMRQELRYYRSCGWLILLFNLALSGMVLSMVRSDRSAPHNEIVTIASAAYTFTTLVWSGISVKKYRKYNSPVLSASRVISLICGCVSILTLEDVMLVTFSDDGMTVQTQRLFLALSGGAVSVFVMLAAIYMIVRANRKISCLEIKYGK